MSRAFCWKRDVTSLSETSLRMVFLPTVIENGPQDDWIEVRGPVRVRGDAQSDFLYHPEKSPEAFDAVHTFCVLRHILLMFQRSTLRIGQPDRLRNWPWGGNLPLLVYPHAGLDKEKISYYSRHERAIKFFYAPIPDSSGDFIYHCRSYEICAHEMGHALLDAFQPGYFSSWHPETTALHESFADMTVIFYLLSQPDQCQAILAHSKGDLHKRSFFAAMAESRAGPGRKTYGMTNAAQNLVMSKASENDIRDLALVFTGAMYDILAALFERERQPAAMDDALVLNQVGQHLFDLFLKAIITGPKENASMAELAHIMITLEPRQDYKKLLRQHFAWRGILVGEKIDAPPPRQQRTRPIDVYMSSCRFCTLHTEEHAHAIRQAIQVKEQQLSCLCHSKAATAPARVHE